MKIRLGHVTNSSSSSYVVAIRHFPVTGLENTYPFIGKIVGNLKKLLEKEDGIDTPEGLAAYYLKEFGSKGKDLAYVLEDYSAEKEYAERLELIENKHTLYFLSLDWDEDGDIQSLLNMLRNESWIKVDGEDF